MDVSKDVRGPQESQTGRAAPKIVLSFTPPSDSPKPAPHLPPSQPHNRPVQLNLGLTPWQQRREWLLPLIGLVAGILAINLWVLSSVFHTDGPSLKLPALLFAMLIFNGIFLAFIAAKALLVVLVCLVVFWFSEEHSLSPFFLSFLQIAGAVAPAAVIGVVLPRLGFWLLEPITFCILLTWFLGIKLGEAMLISVFNYIVYLAALMLAFASLYERFRQAMP